MPKVTHTKRSKVSLYLQEFWKLFVVMDKFYIANIVKKQYLMTNMIKGFNIQIPINIKIIDRLNFNIQNITISIF